MRDFKMKYMFVVQYILIVTIISSLGVNLMRNLKFSMETNIFPDDYQYYFTTVEILSLEGCAKLCHSVTSCKVGSYQSRGHLCRLKHYLGQKQYSISYQKTPNFISWTRDATNQVLTEDNSPCKNISSDQSYMVNYDTGTCNSYACGKPNLGSSFSTLGRVFTTEGKILIWTCYNHEVDIILPAQSITCTNYSRWEGVDDNLAGLSHNCTYTKHTLSDGSVFSYKIVDVHVNQTAALTKCRMDSANLTTIFTLEKLDFYRGIVASSTDDYWVDAQRINRTEWRTSYGQNQPLDSDIWARHDENLNHLCARMRKSRRYRLDDNSCSNQEYSYICERRIN